MSKVDFRASFRLDVIQLHRQFEWVVPEFRANAIL